MKNFFALLIVIVFLALPVTRAQSFFASPGTAELVTNLKVYPNPSTTGEFTTEFLMNNPSDLVSVKVYNLVGREVFREQVSPNTGHYKNSISLRHLPKGVYMLEISKGDKRITRRLSYM